MEDRRVLLDIEPPTPLSFFTEGRITSAECEGESLDS